MQVQTIYRVFESKTRARAYFPETYKMENCHGGSKCINIYDTNKSKGIECPIIKAKIICEAAYNATTYCHSSKRRHLVSHIPHDRF